MSVSGLGQLSQGAVSMGSYGQSIGQLNQSSLNSGLPISTSMASNGSSIYQAHYGLNSLGKQHQYPPLLEYLGDDDIALPRTRTTLLGAENRILLQSLVLLRFRRFQELLVLEVTMKSIKKELSSTLLIVWQIAQGGVCPFSAVSVSAITTGGVT